ncbi:hypothetical protein C8J57DRAFT_1400514 [Mycena rebaudengoi]|nr:hypothetical protein C8J57DRAFT_1400514 [Mycena rebaudengoi]
MTRTTARQHRAGHRRVIPARLGHAGDAQAQRAVALIHAGIRRRSPRRLLCVARLTPAAMGPCPRPGGRVSATPSRATPLPPTHHQARHGRLRARPMRDQHGGRLGAQHRATRIVPLWVDFGGLALERHDVHPGRMTLGSYEGFVCGADGMAKISPPPPTHNSAHVYLTDYPLLLHGLALLFERAQVCGEHARGGFDAAGGVGNAASERGGEKEMQGM